MKYVIYTVVVERITASVYVAFGKPEKTPGRVAHIMLYIFYKASFKLVK